MASHYASAIDFTDEKIEEARKAISKIQILLQRLDGFPLGEQKQEYIDFIKEAHDDFVQAMDDDFNTAKALGCMFELVNDMNKYIDTAKRDQKYTDIMTQGKQLILEFSEQLFGLHVQISQPVCTESESQLIEERKNARLNKDFKRADELRNILKEKGIIIEDTKEGQRWRRI